MKKDTLIWNLLFIFMWAVIYIVFAPVVAWTYFVLMGWETNVKLPFGILSWGFIFDSFAAIRIVIATALLSIFGIIYTYAKIGSDKKSGKGNEYGSAAFMSDEEFLNEFPSYKFRPNEQECIRRSVHMTLKDEIDDDDVFNLIENDFVKNKQEGNPDED